MSENDIQKQSKLRKRSASSEWFLGSAHAVTEDGEILVASGTGSQILPYVYISDNVVFVIGTQKIVKDVDEGLKRIHKHGIPPEDAKMKSAGHPGTTLGKILLMLREINENRKLRVIFVDDVLGF